MPFAKAPTRSILPIFGRRHGVARRTATTPVVTATMPTAIFTPFPAANIAWSPPWKFY